MWDFIKKIFSEREGDVTVVVLDDQNPDGSSSFKLAALDIVKVVFLVFLISVTVTTIIFFATPLGSLYQQQQDQSLREDVIAVSERLMSLQDSLNARDNQLRDMKKVLRLVPDTSFNVETVSSFQSGTRENEFRRDGNDVYAFDMLSQDEIIFSGNLERSPDFPSALPIRGSLSQGYDSNTGHFGIDFSAPPNTEFQAIADGVVMNTDWTINYGFVVYLQHSNGIITVYKHGSRLLKKQGDFVLKGDILGVVDDTGVLSSGSHLHLEIWKNGVPQNPKMYLNN